MKFAAILLIYAGAYFVCAQSDFIAGFAPLIGLGLIPVAGKILD